MTPHDQQRFAEIISDFVDDCGFEKPFHLVVIDARGAASVTRYGHNGVDQICSGPAKANRLRMIPPLDSDLVGRGRQVGEDRDRGGKGDDAVTSASRLLSRLLALLACLLSRLRLAGAVAVHQRA